VDTVRIWSMAIDSRIDAVEKQYPEPSEPPVDLVLSLGELAFPAAAPVLEFAKLVNGHLSKAKREERVRAFFDLLRDREKFLDALSERVDSLKVKVEDLAEAAETAAWRDADAPNDRKRDRYLKILGNAVRSAEQIQDVASFIRDVEELGEEDLTVLKVLNKVMNSATGWGPPGQRKLHPNNFIQKREELVVQVAKALGISTDTDSTGQTFSREEGYSICARLQGFGLAHEIDVSPREVPVGDYCFRPSKRGLMLLRLIGEEVPNWDRYFPPQKKAT
jgi:hypothetical protein